MKNLMTAAMLVFSFCASAQIGIGTTSPSAILHLKAGTSTASTAPLKFTAGTNLTTTEAGTVEYDGSHLYFTATNGGTRYQLDQQPFDTTNISNFYLKVRSLHSGTSPITYNSTTGAIGITQATTSTNGYLSSTDWNTFNNKVSSQWTTSGSNIYYNTGNVGIGSSSFNGTNPEKLLVDAGTTTSVNAIVGKGTINSYLQLNIQNLSSGTGASSDVVATADNGSETTNYVDMGINGSGNTSAVMGGANDAYLYNIGQNSLIGTGTSAKSLVFLTGGQSQASNERMRIDGSGNVGIGTNSPNSTFEANGSIGFPITTTSTDITLGASNYTVILTNSTPAVTLPAAAAGNARRIYIIVNNTNASRTISTYKNFAGTNTTTIAANSSITIQSDGSAWYRIQ